MAVKICYLNFDLLAPEDMGLNPKVVNMLPGLENAKYEMVWMVDAGFLGGYMTAYLMYSTRWPLIIIIYIYMYCILLKSFIALP